LDISKKGFFIEVGAFDGESFSNTSWLADIGWKGMYIEPILEYADRCRSRHSKNNVTVINCAVGAKDGLIKINVGEQLTTASIGTLEAYKILSGLLQSLIFRKEKCHYSRSIVFCKIIRLLAQLICWLLTLRVSRSRSSVGLIYLDMK
jgi:hypothetical protein